MQTDESWRVYDKLDRAMKAEMDITKENELVNSIIERLAQELKQAEKIRDLRDLNGLHDFLENFAGSESSKQTLTYAAAKRLFEFKG
jgi:hypothetical protein